ncbi:gamma-glutamylcyclotransferase family protein [Sphingomonas cavernae]|uniref:Gamma-glutamylcyclotransferase n=1 Tax=Sphingomonas cavernae TaxID=2320861 RepID=A0A418WSD5_9SPHN|nr:gamma-glutamylcyclotransferase family protein [Sphingomonas cavernae]RJF94106.1 gamma-glutamylcyclotransferase [Sphingomonas cavernae]
MTDSCSIRSNAITVRDPGLLFVYGTLRRGSAHAMAARLARDVQWIGPATTRGHLFRVDWYPALAPSAGGGTVLGDLVRLLNPVASMAWLDVYEDCGVDDPLPHEYGRAWISVTCAGVVREAQAYVWNRPLDGLDRIEGGDWLGSPGVPGVDNPALPGEPGCHA